MPKAQDSGVGLAVQQLRDVAEGGIDDPNDTIEHLPQIDASELAETGSAVASAALDADSHHGGEIVDLVLGVGDSVTHVLA